MAVLTPQLVDTDTPYRDLHLTRVNLLDLASPHFKPSRHYMRAELHRAVMAIFDSQIPTEKPGTARASAGILYRVDPTTTGRTVLVQSLMPPKASLHLSSLETKVISARAHPRPGRVIAVRATINPVNRAHGKIVDKVEDVPAWFERKTFPAFGDIAVVNMVEESLRGPKGSRLRTVTLDALARVEDADALWQLRLHGVGRAKSYGCGLLSLAPAPR